MKPDSIDPVIGLAKALALIVGASTAEWLAPQLGVFLAGVAGGGIGVMGWRKCSRVEACLYALFSGVFAWLFASMLAGWASVVFPSLAQAENITHASALIIGGVGHRWPAVAKWVGSTIRAAVEAALIRGPKP